MDLAKGASLLNTLALDESGVVNRERQRFADEFVRHKILDAIGDMALAGAPLLARFEGANPAMPPTMPCCASCFPTPPIMNGWNLSKNRHFPEPGRSRYIEPKRREPVPTDTLSH